MSETWGGVTLPVTLPTGDGRVFVVTRRFPDGTFQAYITPHGATGTTPLTECEEGLYDASGKLVTSVSPQ